MFFLSLIILNIHEPLIYKESEFQKLTSTLASQTSTELEKTCRVLHMHARPGQSQLAGAASLRGASGKPSTWFSLG